MPKPTLSLTLLSLFTTRERALEIEGDLLEETASHSKLWFISQVLTTTLALYGRAFMQAPLKTLLFAAIVGEFIFLTLWFGPIIINLHPNLFPEYLLWLNRNDPVFFLVLMPLVTYITGLILMKLASESGMRIMMTSLMIFILLVISLFSSTLLSTSNITVFTAQSIMWILLAGIYFVLMMAIPMLFGGIQIFRSRLATQ